jgi:hypothetical protein
LLLLLLGERPTEEVRLVGDNEGFNSPAEFDMAAGPQDSSSWIERERPVPDVDDVILEEDRLLILLLFVGVDRRRLSRRRPFPAK